VESGAVESGAVESGPVEPTQAYGAGEGGGAAADEPDDDSGPHVEAPTPLHSQAR